MSFGKPTVSSQVLDHSETSLTVRNSGVKVMLLAVLIDAEALEVNVTTRTELRLDRPRNVDGRLHGKLLHPALHHGEVDGDYTRHLNRATERNLAIALREVQITNGELGALHVHGKVDLAAARQVLDVTVAAVLRATGHGTSALFADFLFDRCVRATGMDVLGLGRECDIAVHV